MTVAVTGATGQLGRLVVEALLRKQVPVVAVVRNRAKAADLTERGVDVRQATYDDPESLDVALAGVDRVLLVSGTETGGRVGQHTNVVRAAEHAGVELLVYTSIPKADRNEMILAQDHKATEAVLAGATVPRTILRNSWYWENYTGGLAHAVETGVLYGAAGEGRVSGAARADFAEAAATVLATDGHAGRVYELGGDAITYAELADAISRASGKQVRYQDLPPAEFTAALERAGVPAGFAQVLADADAGIAKGILSVDSGELHELIGRPATPAIEVFRAALN
ncbi:SDR family oxidoreductase [Kribbella catacumbae]|uniref:SDR family oxidoreductase n=1 Tax=Kribbella catacumbae TaxID=460086 RepID=UPI00036FF31D|nr:SDR family oxidoreductase [Kribbella catacumbae]